jgi:hypothetical protein
MQNKEHAALAEPTITPKPANVCCTHPETSVRHFQLYSGPGFNIPVHHPHLQKLDHVFAPLAES